MSEETTTTETIEPNPATTETASANPSTVQSGEGKEVEGGQEQGKEQPQRFQPDNVPYSRFQQVIRKGHEKDARIAEMEQRIAQYEGRTTAPRDDFPDVNDPQYKSLEDYQSAVQKYAEATSEKRAHETVAQHRQRMEVESVVSGFNSRAAELAATHPDIGQAIEVFKTYESEFDPSVFKSIVADKNGPKIVMEIASRPELAQALAQATPFEAGRILASLDVSKSPATKAPIPVTKTVNGPATSTETDPSKMNTAQYAAWRSKQEF